MDRVHPSGISSHALEEALRLIVVTDAAQAGPRELLAVVKAALQGGARCVQLRMKDASARELVAAGTELRRLTQDFDALLIVNDRADVAEEIGADGVHVGPNDPPVAALRDRFPALVIGASTDDPARAQALERAGADYLGCGAVFGTTSKDVGGEAIGPDQLSAVARAVRIPVVGIGGITPDNVSQLAGGGAAGVAVIGAVMAAPDPVESVQLLMARFQPS